MRAGMELRPSSHELAELDRDSLRFWIVLKRRFAILAALAGHLETTEWCRRVDDMVAVDPHRAGLHFLRIKVSFVDVLGPNAGGQAVIGLVGSFDNLIHALERQHADDR